MKPDQIAAPAAIVKLLRGAPLAPVGPTMQALVSHMGGTHLPNYPPRFYAFDTQQADHLIVDVDWTSLLDQGSAGWLYGHVMDAYVESTGLQVITTMTPAVGPWMEGLLDRCGRHLYIPTSFLLTDALHFAFPEMHKLLLSPKYLAKEVHTARAAPHTPES